MSSSSSPQPTSSPSKKLNPSQQPLQSPHQANTSQQSPSQTAGWDFSSFHPESYPVHKINKKKQPRKCNKPKHPHPPPKKSNSAAVSASNAKLNLKQPAIR